MFVLLFQRCVWDCFVVFRLPNEKRWMHVSRWEKGKRKTRKRGQMRPASNVHIMIFITGFVYIIIKNETQKEEDTINRYYPVSA